MTKDEAFERILRMTRQIENRGEQDYVTALILGINGKQLSKAQKQRLREVLGMTGIVKEIWHDVLEEGEKKGHEAGKLEGKLETARNLLAMGLTVDQIVQATGLSASDVTKLQEENH